MKHFTRLALAACAVGALGLVASTAAEARCSRASAKGFGITQDMARDMAKMNLDAGIAAKGQKSGGRTHYKCSGPMIMSECTATRRAC